MDAPTSDSETVEMFDPSTIAPGGNEMTQAQLLASTGASAEFPSGATHSRTQTDGSRQVVTSGAVA